jgi:hypothetical protein
MLVRKCVWCVLVVLVVLAISSSAARAGLIDGLTAYWSFDSGFGATVGGAGYDAVGMAGSGGTAPTGVSTTNSKFGGASLGLSHASLQYVQAASPFGTGDYSYSAWYYLNDDDITPWPGEDRRQVLEASDASRDAFSASFLLEGADGPNDLARAFMSTTGGYTHVTAASGAHQTWRNVVVTAHYDSGANATTLTAYLDGTSLGTSSQAGSPKATTLLNIGNGRADSDAGSQ